MKSEDKKKQLEKLKRDMHEDKTLPLRAGATQLVFGDGNPDTDTYFLGEAPGYWEDKQGKPFVGQAGKLLDQLIESIGLKREDMYISNVVRFRPPENRDPTLSEIKAFEKYVDSEIEIINPKVIVTLGRWSMGKFLPDTVISRVHGKPQKIDWHGRGIIVVPMYHPAAALHQPRLLDQMREDFKAIPKVLEEARKEKVEQMNLM